MIDGQIAFPGILGIFGILIIQFIVRKINAFFIKNDIFSNDPRIKTGVDPDVIKAKNGLIYV
jgi:hypothetical protein